MFSDGIAPQKARPPAVIVLGGDGFCGWPISLHLSRHGYDVTIVDDQSRRAIDAELGTDSLTPIGSIDARLRTWTEVTGKAIRFEKFRVGEQFEAMVDLLRSTRPVAVVHAACQRSAPYSMKSHHTMRATVTNNVSATSELLCAIVASGADTHLVHFGSMGVYGYQSAGFKVPEGYLPVTIDTEAGPLRQEILFPGDPGSIYHVTKAMDQLLFKFYAKNYGLRVTDLHQGIVWGTETDETRLHDGLVNRFDYDGDYGTVLNRFLMQAAIGFPLTVHGDGGQTRSFIHVKDTVRCIRIAIENAPGRAERVRIFNQATEVHRVVDLARKVSQLTGVPYRFVSNPRVEPATNELAIDNTSLLELGLQPTLLDAMLLEEIRDVAIRFSHRCDPTKIPSTSRWRPDTPLLGSEQENLHFAK